MQVKIEKLDNQGRGIGYFHDKILFVPKTLPEEVITFSLRDEKKSYQIGELKEILVSSDKRVEAHCPYYGICGGCDYQHVSYAESVQMKQQILVELFQKQGLWMDPIVFHPSSNPFFYRNKLSLKVQNGKYGFYFAETHQFVEITTCLLARSSIQRVMDDFSLFAFQNGELTIRTSENDEILVDIVTKEEVTFEESFFTRHKVAGILVNHQCIYGEPFFFERKDGVLYQVNAASFFQVNPEMSSVLFKTIQKLVRGSEGVLDLYCGVGTLGLQVFKKVQHVTGIEVVSSAIMNAMLNAKLNHATNMDFHLGKVEDILSKIPTFFDTVIIDPPRAGMDEKCIQVLREKKPSQILYVSCNPLTLIRDLKRLTSFYQLTFVEGFDMFPYTKHVECVCVLKLR